MSEPTKRCKACDIIASQWAEQGGIIYETACWQAGSWFWHPPVMWAGAMSIILKRHCEHLAELTPEEAEEIGPFIHAICQALANVVKAANVHVFSFGDGCKHVHFWVLPQSPKMRPGMRSILFNFDMRLMLARSVGIKRWIISEEEVAHIAEQIRNSIHQQLGGLHV